uniref:Ankyrin repeat and LEM domain containing 1 n=1 Tax=Suricata suricatta TaxID=37032 RepID=A0A673TYF8_SURSU
MAAAAGLAQKLRAALREEEPRAVEELLRRGADPNLVLADGAAAVHLAARARHSRGLRCLEALLHRGGDANARSVEALTPLHVAAAWGCRRGLELLLGHGADPALRDQDGLRPLDLAELQGHQDCAHVLRELQTRTKTSTRTRAESQEPEPEPGGGWGLPCGPLSVALGSTALGRRDGRDMGLEAGPRLLRHLAHPEIADKGSSLEYPPGPPGQRDCSSDASFVTATEASGTEDLAPHTSSWARSSPQTKQRLLPTVRPSQGMPRSPGAPQEAELNTCLQALTLTSPDASTSPISLPSCPRKPRPELPDLPFPKDEELYLDSEVAALWLTEDEASSTGGRDPGPSCWCPLVPATAEAETPPGLRGLGSDFAGHSPELAKALRTGCIPDAQADEDVLAQQFERPDPKRKWREGVVKSSFTYLLLDPRETQDLPARAFSLTPAERLRTFVHAIFYVGKGTRARPDAHLWEALNHRRQPRKQACPKVRQILDIWASGRGVVSLHCFQHVVAVEAYTREACLVDALGIQTLTNQRQGHCYGVVASWPPTRRRRLGVHLLHRALLVFLAEGERELRPQDIQARGRVRGSWPSSLGRDQGA